MGNTRNELLEQIDAKISAFLDDGARTLIHQYASSTIEATLISTAQQDAPFDAVDIIKFNSFIVGSNGVPVAITGNTSTENNLVQYNNTTHDFTILKSGYYGVKTRQRAQRVGASAGVSKLFVQAQISLDNGVTWLPTGNAVDITLDYTREVNIFFDFSQLNFPAGVKLRQVFGRSSSGGTDYGSFVPSTPSAGLSADGVQIAPSTQLTIYRLNDVAYYV